MFDPLGHPDFFISALARLSAMSLLFVLVVVIRNAIVALIRRKRGVVERATGR
jgi:hypothetical protein